MGAHVHTEHCGSACWLRLVACCSAALCLVCTRLDCASCLNAPPCLPLPVLQRIKEANPGIGVADVAKVGPRSGASCCCAWFFALAGETRQLESPGLLHCSTIQAAP